MLPAVTRPEPPTTGDERVLFQGVDGSQRSLDLTPRTTFAEGDRRLLEPAEGLSISVEGDSDADKVPVATADVELCMSLLLEEGARRERSDRPVGE